MFEGWGVAAAAIGAAGAIGGAAISANGAKSAAAAQQQAAQSANATQLSMFNTISGNEQPYNQEGQNANFALGQFYGLYKSGNGSGPNYNQILSNLPGYQFQLQQGTQAIDRSEAAKGLLNSGATGKALEQYGQGLAGSYAQQYTSGLAGLAQLGQASASNQAAAGMNTANQIGANTLYGGNAAAAGIAGQTNAISGGLGQAAGLYGMYQNYQQNQPVYASTISGSQYDDAYNQVAAANAGGLQGFSLGGP